MKTTTGRTLDHVAHVYDLLSPLMLFGQEARISRDCLPWLEDRRVSRVLDVGCGTGTLTIEMGRRLAARPGAEIIGIDAAPRMIEVARRKAAGLPQVRFDTGIAEELPYPDASFDLVVSTFFFHHIDLALKIKTLDEIWRVLQFGATAVIIDVDVPRNTFGRICAWSGYYLFHQEEIRENIEGQLRLAMERSRFGQWEKVAFHQGYITTFKLIKMRR